MTLLLNAPKPLLWQFDFHVESVYSGVQNPVVDYLWRLVTTARCGNLLGKCPMSKIGKSDKVLRSGQEGVCGRV